MGFTWLTSEGISSHPVRSIPHQSRSVERVTKARSVAPKINDHESNTRSEDTVYNQKLVSELYKEQELSEKVLTLGDIMSTPVTTAAPDESLRSVWTLIENHKFRHIPITNEKGEVLGIVSDRDLLKAGSPFLPKRPHSSKPIHEERVKTIMRSNLLTATADCSVREGSAVFFNENVGSLLITEQISQLIGIVTRSDVLRALNRLLPLERWI